MEGVAGGLAREWSEELVADWTPDFVPVGLLNDDTDPVGAVHLGVVYRVEAAGRPVGIRETHKLEGHSRPSPRSTPWVTDWRPGAGSASTR